MTTPLFLLRCVQLGLSMADLEETIEAVLLKHGIFYGKSETWIESEKLYEVLYETEV